VSRRARPRHAIVPEHEIIRIAARLFSEKGFSATSIRDIATECGVNIPSIYHYFGDKTDLYERCCESVFGRISVELGAVQDHVVDPYRYVKHFATALCKAFAGDSEFRQLLLHELAQSDSKRADRIVQRYFERHYASLREAIGKIEGNMSARASSISLFALTFGLAILRPLSELDGARLTTPRDPARLALFVLHRLFPGHDWNTA
jgi:AcrR family transcriptional regulator